MIFRGRNGDATCREVALQLQQPQFRMEDNEGRSVELTILVTAAASLSGVGVVSAPAASDMAYIPGSPVWREGDYHSTGDIGDKRIQ